MDVFDEACLRVTAAAERKQLIDKLLKEKRAALKAIKAGRKLKNGGSGGRPKKRAKAKSDALMLEIAKIERGFLIDENEPPAPPRPDDDMPRSGERSEPKRFFAVAIRGNQMYGDSG